MNSIHEFGGSCGSRVSKDDASHAENIVAPILSCVLQNTTEGQVLEDALGSALSQHSYAEVLRIRSFASSLCVACDRVCGAFSLPVGADKTTGEVGDLFGNKPQNGGAHEDQAHKDEMDIDPQDNCNRTHNGAHSSFESESCGNDTHSRVTRHQACGEETRVNEIVMNKSHDQTHGNDARHPELNSKNRPMTAGEDPIGAEGPGGNMNVVRSSESKNARWQRARGGGLRPAAVRKLDEKSETDATHIDSQPSKSTNPSMGADTSPLPSAEKNSRESPGALPSCLEQLHQNIDDFILDKSDLIRQFEESHASPETYKAIFCAIQTSPAEWKPQQHWSNGLEWVALIEAANCEHHLGSLRYALAAIAFSRWHKTQVLLLGSIHSRTAAAEINKRIYGHMPDDPEKARKWKRSRGRLGTHLSRGRKLSSLVAKLGFGILFNAW